MRQDELQRLTATLMAKMAQVPGLVDLDTSMKPPKPTVVVDVKRDAASDLGLSVGSPSMLTALSALGAAELVWVRSLQPMWQWAPDIFLCHGTPRSDCEHFLETPRGGVLGLATAAEIATTAPTEMSMPRVAITSVMPRATSISGAARCSVFCHENASPKAPRNSSTQASTGLPPPNQTNRPNTASAAASAWWPAATTPWPSCAPAASTSWSATSTCPT